MQQHLYKKASSTWTGFFLFHSRCVATSCFNFCLLGFYKYASGLWTQYCQMLICIFSVVTYSTQEADVILSGAWLILFGILLAPLVYVVIQQSELNSDNLFYRNLKIKSKQRQQKTFSEMQNIQSEGSTWHLGTYCLIKM